MANFAAHGHPILSSPSGQGLNRFAYVDNNPLNFTDPSGFTPDDGPSVNGRAGFPLLDFAMRHANEIAEAGVAVGGAYALWQLGAGPTVIASSGGTAAAVTGVSAGSSAIPATTVLSTVGHVTTAMIAIDHIINPGGLGSAPQPTVQPTRQSVSAGATHPSIGQAHGMQISPGQEGSSPAFHDPVSDGGQRLKELLTVPKPVPGNVTPGEPITDPYVRRALRDAWIDSRPQAEDRTEQGGFIHSAERGRWVERWKPGGTDYIDPGDALPEPGSASFHTHPSNEVHGITNPRDASLGDWIMYRGFLREDPAHIHYILSVRGIYRLNAVGQQWIAPIGYLFTY